MKNFQFVGNFDPFPLLHTLQTTPKIWDVHRLRTMYPQSPHYQVSDVWVRFNVIDPENPLAAANDKECINYEAYYLLPQIRPLLFDLMRKTESEQLGRVLITKLAPGKQITPHEDAGSPATWYERYHAVLQNGPGSLFHCGDETVCMKPGEIYWFDNQKTHSVVNNSKDDRITIIIDARPCK